MPVGRWFVCGAVRLSHSTPYLKGERLHTSSAIGSGLERCRRGSGGGASSSVSSSMVRLTWRAATESPEGGSGMQDRSLEELLNPARPRGYGKLLRRVVLEYDR